MSINRTSDAVLETLFLPFVTGDLQWPGEGALFLRARAGSALQQQPLPGLVCEQSFKPDAEALERMGFAVSAGDGASDENRKFPLVLLLPPRQRDEARALMARAVDAASGGGRVVVCVANTEGARSSEGDLLKIAGDIASLSKNKCRVFWTAPLQGPADPELAAQWRGLDAARPVVDGRFISRPGVFAWDRIDIASALLAEHLPANLTGRAADLGAGFGYLSAELLARCPGISSLDVYEAEKRALDLARRNLAAFEPRVRLEYHWHDVTQGLPHTYDVIVSNPPFHTGSSESRPDIGRAFIAAAARALRPGGRLLMVANRQLPYETVLNENFGSVRTVTQQQGFKVIEGVRASGSAR